MVCSQGHRGSSKVGVKIFHKSFHKQPSKSVPRSEPSQNGKLWEANKNWRRERDSPAPFSEKSFATWLTPQDETAKKLRSSLNVTELHSMSLTIIAIVDDVCTNVSQVPLLRDGGESFIRTQAELHDRLAVEAT